jgi:hypothetical protein
MWQEALWYLGIAFTILIFLIGFLHFLDDEDE